MNFKKVSPPLRETRFDNNRVAGLGVEWMTLAELRRRVPPERLVMPERLDFYMLLLITHGVGEHMVDFVQSPLSPGSFVFVRPGQVQQWLPDDSLDGSLAVVTAQALLPGATRSTLPEMEGLLIDEWPAVTLLPQSLLPEIVQAMDCLRQDFERFDHSAQDAALIRHDVRGLLMRLGRWFAAEVNGSHTGSVERATYRLFIRTLETTFHLRLSVKDYAARLGYSESTLSRACLAAEGRSAKQVIDRRVALEAGRQLVHSQLSVAEIGHHLGFTEATNFVKFFGRMSGISPQTFRKRKKAQGSMERPIDPGAASE
jgi:AraC-like DNA-binding protein